MYIHTLHTLLVILYMAKRSLKPHRSWCFTWNNYSKENVAHLLRLFHNLCNKFCFQEEIGTEGTPHLQGVFNLKNGKNFINTKKMLGERVHLEVCKNFRYSWKYCCKEDTRNGKIWSFPLIFNDGKPLSKAQMSGHLLELMLDDPEFMEDY